MTPSPFGAPERRTPQMLFGKLDDMLSRVAAATDAVRKHLFSLRPPHADSFHARRHDEYRPWEQPNEHNGHEIPEGLRVVIEVSAEARQVVLENKDADEIRVLDLYRDIPRDRYGAEEQHPGDPK